MIANIGIRLPDAQFFGISLNCDNFVERHGIGAFPLLAHLQFAGRAGTEWEQPKERDSLAGSSNKGRGVWVREVKSALKRVPALSQCLKVAGRTRRVAARLRRVAARILMEVRHSVEGYRFLRTQHLLVVSGGGQLTEEWGGAWQHPFGLFKWAILARVARVPYVVASVGASRFESTASKMFISAALRMARYRSYRDKNSRDVATGLLRQATADSVAPDLAFSLLPSQLPLPASIRAMARSRKVIAISPISYGKPGMWSFQNRALYDRYVREMAQVVSQLLGRGCFLVIVWSCLGADKSVIDELLRHLDEGSKQRLAEQLLIPTIETWSDLVATLRDTDFLIASRLHSAILGFVSETPTVAISSGSKVDRVMADLDQTDYLVQIRDFTSKDVIEALDRLELRRDIVLQQISSYRRRILPVLALQYDVLADMATASHRTTSRVRRRRSTAESMYNSVSSEPDAGHCQSHRPRL